MNRLQFRVGFPLAGRGSCINTMRGPGALLLGEVIVVTNSQKVNAEALLIAAGQNVKRLLFYGDRRPKKLAQVVALRPPAPIYRGPDRVRQHRRSRDSAGQQGFSQQPDKLSFQFNR